MLINERAARVAAEKLLELVRPLQWDLLQMQRGREEFEWALVKVMCVGVWCESVCADDQPASEWV